MYPDWLNEILRSPADKSRLTNNVDYFESAGTVYRFYDDILSIAYPDEISGTDLKYNRFYNLFAPLYDLNERVMGKLLTGVDITRGRQQIVSMLGFRSGMRILEVSPGPGVFQEYLRKSIGDSGEFVALDLSMGMLRQCRKKNSRLNIHLVHANAQYLPFADNSFDALFHFGGINLFNDPQKAISEFVRVVKKNGIVTWGDEGFSENYSNERRKRMLVRINPGFAKPRPPVPETVYNVDTKEVYDGLGYLIIAKKR